MATISPFVAPSESSSVILPTTTTTSTPYDIIMCDESDSAMMQTDDVDAPLGTVIDESTQGGALDALAALAAASTAVSVSSVSSSQQQLPSHQYHQPQEITPHQTSSDDDSEIMPPPPPRSPTTMLAAAAMTSNACAPSAPLFTFLHDSDTLDPSLTFQNNRFANSNTGGGGGRTRSASNPEGMEKWDFYSRRNDRQHFVLPFSILEEELASTRRVLGEVVDDGSGGEYTTMDGIAGKAATHGFTPQTQQQDSTKTDAAAGFQQHWVRRSRRSITARFGTSPDSVGSDLGEEEEDSSSPATSPTAKTTAKSNTNNNSSSTNTSSSTKSRKKAAAHSESPPDIISSQSPPPDEDDDDFDESTLEPEELLRRARSRLLEDLSEGSGNGLNGEKGGSVLILPHSLSKYKEVYNKNGRIGIYTPAERAAIIQKFNAKRARRVWNKKIRYNCRKNLADRRMRVKGRFVKRSVEAAGSPPPSPAEEEEEETRVVRIRAKAASRSNSPPTSGSPLPTVNEDEEPPPDEEMPDVDDEEAGFEPSEDMPYRRTRRYTIT